MHCHVSPAISAQYTSIAFRVDCLIQANIGTNLWWLAIKKIASPCLFIASNNFGGLLIIEDRYPLSIRTTNKLIDIVFIDLPLANSKLWVFFPSNHIIIHTMPSSIKRRKKSGLTGVELTIALNALDNLIKKSRQEEALNKEVSEEDVADVEELEQLEDILALLQSKADSPQVHATDAMNTAIWHIEPEPFILWHDQRPFGKHEHLLLWLSQVEAHRVSSSQVGFSWSG